MLLLKKISTNIFLKENYNICSWLFTHLRNVVQSVQNSQTIDSLSPIWVPNLKVSKPLFTNLVNFAHDLFGNIDLDPGRIIIRWKDSSTNLALPESIYKAFKLIFILSRRNVRVAKRRNRLPRENSFQASFA